MPRSRSSATNAKISTAIEVRQHKRKQVPRQARHRAPFLAVETRPLEAERSEQTEKKLFRQPSTPSEQRSFHIFTFIVNMDILEPGLY